jgi:hypothetical protein
MQSQLDWSVLDVEEDEWEKHIDALGLAAAANGFPVYTGPQQKSTSNQNSAQGTNPIRRCWLRRPVVIALASMLILAAVVSYSMWRRAQQGITHLQSDVANAIELETLQVRTQQPSLHEHEALEAVEFIDDKAMAQVVITRTLSSGQVVAKWQTRFYVQTPKGWQPTEPVAAFWGQPETFDTPSLHFVFRSRDRAAVELLASTAEAVYATLRRATGQTLAATGVLTVEIVPEHVPASEEGVDRRIRLPSPLLFNPIYDLSSEQIFVLLLGKPLRNQVLDTALRRTPAKPQWQPMVAGLRYWLLSSDALALAPSAKRATIYPAHASSHGYLPLSSLLGCNPCSSSRTYPSRESHHVDNLYQQGQKGAATWQLIDFIVATYGIESLPALLQGFGQYEDWESLAPAALGLTAAELEAAWHGKAAPRP